MQHNILKSLCLASSLLVAPAWAVETVVVRTYFVKVTAVPEPTAGLGLVICGMVLTKRHRRANA